MKINLFFYTLDFQFEVKRIKGRSFKEIVSKYKKALRIFLLSKIHASNQVNMNGTASLSKYDWRTNKEKFNDNTRSFINSFLEEKKFKYTTRKEARSVKRFAFSSWFDIGVGKKVSSREDIKKLEKEGQLFMNDSEMDRESAKYQKYNREKQRKQFDERWQKTLERQRRGEFKSSRYVERVNREQILKGVH